MFGKYYSIDPEARMMDDKLNFSIAKQMELNKNQLNLTTIQTEIFISKGISLVFRTKLIVVKA